MGLHCLCTRCFLVCANDATRGPTSVAPVSRQACLRARPVNRGSFLFEYVMVSNAAGEMNAYNMTLGLMHEVLAAAAAGLLGYSRVREGR